VTSETNLIYESVTRQILLQSTMIDLGSHPPPS